MGVNTPQVGCKNHSRCPYTNYFIIHNGHKLNSYNIQLCSKRTINILSSQKGVCATFVRACKSMHGGQFSMHTVISCYNCCAYPRSTSRPINKLSWWRSIVVRPLVLAGELSLSCARLMAGRVTTLWVRRPLSVNQHGQLSQPSLRDRLNE